jgi:hypothetical protein
MEILYKYMLNGIRVRSGRRDEKTLSKYRAYREIAGGIPGGRNKSPRK